MVIRMQYFIICTYVFIGSRFDLACCVVLMHLTAEGRKPEAVICIIPPEALSFPTQQPVGILTAFIG